jgi:uncharacterized protein with von Willebrand factor type A (vWA) domain
MAAAEGGAAVAGTALVRRLVEFGRALRATGAEVGPGRLRDALLALDAVGLGSRDSVYWALRCTLISRAEQIPAFDAAFASFWGEEARPGAVHETLIDQPPPGGAPVEEALPDAELRERLVESLTLDAGDGDDEDDEEASEMGQAWSASERLRALDFSAYTATEMRAAKRLIDRVALAGPRRRSRRLEPAHDGRQLDKRLTLRSAMRTEGYPLERAWRRRRLVRRRLVFLVDVSGSMEAYARATIMFLHAAIGPGRKVEAFTFGTRLTRVTAELAHSDPDVALRAAAGAVPDWAGGTRIGDNLAAFNERFGRRGLTRGAVVVIVSDGWERGDTALLGAEMERIARSAHTVVWVNPLAGEPGYEPLVQGMVAALPHVDVFMPGHNLASFEELASVLEALPGAGGRR